MKISASIIYSELKKFGTRFEGEENNLNDFVYDIYAVDITSDKGNVIGIEACEAGKPSVVIKTGDAVLGCTNLIYENENYLGAILTTLKKLFKRYDEWENELNNILLSKGSLDEYLKCSYKILGNSISVSDSDGRYLALMGIQSIPEKFRYVRGLEFIDPRMIDAPENFLKSKCGIHLAYSDYLGCNVLYVDLFSSGKLNGQIVLCDYNRPFEESDKYLLKFLAKYIEKALENYDLAGEKQTEARAAVSKLIRGKNITPLEISEIKGHLQFIHENGTRSLYCLAVQRNTDYFSTKYVAYQVERELAGSLAVSFENAFGVILNRECNLNELKWEIEPIIEKYSLSVGVSDKFEDFFKLKDYYDQALSALSFGLEKPSTKNIFFFGDYALEYFFKNATSKLPAEMIAAREVVEMKKRDLEHSVKYSESLKIYLEENMNATNAAKRLSIQRNTFLARLERIKKMLELDLNNPKERLYVLISLLILDI